MRLVLLMNTRNVCKAFCFLALKESANTCYILSHGGVSTKMRAWVWRLVAGWLLRRLSPTCCFYVSHLADKGLYTLSWTHFYRVVNNQRMGGWCLYWLGAMTADRRFIWFLFPVKYELISEKAALNDSKEVGWLWQQPGSGGRAGPVRPRRRSYFCSPVVGEMAVSATDWG